MRIIGDGGHASVIKDFVPYWWIELEHAFIAIGDNTSRKREVEKTFGPFATVVHDRAFVSRSATIGEGTVIMAGAVVQAGARIGKHVIINTGATVDHDCVIGDYAHIAPGAHLCGHVEVGEGALVGAGVCVAPMGKIPAWTLAKMRRLELVPLQGN